MRLFMERLNHFLLVQRIQKGSLITNVRAGQLLPQHHDDQQVIVTQVWDFDISDMMVRFTHISTFTMSLTMKIVLQVLLAIGIAQLLVNFVNMFLERSLLMISNLQLSHLMTT